MQIVDWLLIGWIIGLAYLGFSTGFLANVGVLLGIKLACIAARLDSLRIILGSKLGIASQLVIAGVIFTTAFLFSLSLSRILTTSLDHKSVLLWLPNRLFGALLGLAASIVLIAQTWIWLGSSILDLTPTLANSPVSTWAIQQDKRFGLSEKVLGLAEESLHKVNGIMKLQKEHETNQNP